MPAGPETWKMHKYFHLVALSVSCKKKYSFISNLNSSGGSHAGSLFTNKEQKRLAYSSAFHTFTTHSCRVYDITYTGCWAQNGNTQSCFHNPKAPNFNKQGEKLCEKVLCVY